MSIYFLFTRSLEKEVLASIEQKKGVNSEIIPLCVTLQTSSVDAF